MVNWRDINTIDIPICICICARHHHHQYAMHIGDARSTFTGQTGQPAKFIHFTSTIYIRMYSYLLDFGCECKIHFVHSSAQWNLCCERTNEHSTECMLKGKKDYILYMQNSRELPIYVR